MKNPNISQNDWQVALKRSIDPESDAMRTQLLDASIELNAEDGDSVKALPDSFVLMSGEEMSAKRLKHYCLYGQGSVSISPTDDGDLWVTVYTQSAPNYSQSEVKDICARRIKFACAPGEQGMLVVQS